MVKRRKLRTCIRKDTYIYEFASQGAKEAWSKLEKEFGKSREWGSFAIWLIENSSFILRYSSALNAITVIRKKYYDVEREKKIHKLMGYRAHA